MFGNWDLGPNLKKPASIRFSATGVEAVRLPVIVCLSYYIVNYMIQRVSKYKKKNNKQKKEKKMKVSTTKT